MEKEEAGQEKDSKFTTETKGVTKAIRRRLTKRKKYDKIMGWQRRF
ncbi:MAG: hypothetical protein QME07_00645 [bacterium]|nr:hypothetical protein [bacterium]